MIWRQQLLSRESHCVHGAGELGCRSPAAQSVAIRHLWGRVPTDRERSLAQVFKKTILRCLNDTGREASLLPPDEFTHSLSRERRSFPHCIATIQQECVDGLCGGRLAGEGWVPPHTHTFLMQIRKATGR